MIVDNLSVAEQPWDPEPPIMPESFRTWRSSVIKDGKLPIVGVAGLRGKTAVLHLIDHILTTAGHRTALWTSSGVEIAGDRQESELGAWQDVVRHLIDGTVSVALQELDAATVLATGLPNDFYPLLAVTNICWNDELCQLHREGQLAIKAMPRILAAVSHTGALIANGEDFTLFDAIRKAPSLPTVYFALNRNVPLIRQHVALGGIATWRDAGVIRCGVEEDAPAISCTPELPYTLFGGATFQISNVLAACSVALLMGIKPADIERALLTYDPNPERSPGTMSVLRKRGITVIIDRTDPSWFMRPVLRGIRTMSKGRLFVVTGRLSSVPMGDVPEVGRMLGRDADALILFDHEGDPSHMDSLIQGARRVLDPPLVARYPSKHRAIEAALRRMREGDCLLVLTDKPADALASVRSVNDLAMADQALLEAPMERI